MGYILLLLQDFLVASLHEICFKAYRHLDVDIVLNVILRDQFDFSVILRDPKYANHKRVRKAEIEIVIFTYLLNESK